MYTYRIYKALGASVVFKGIAGARNEYVDIGDGDLISRMHLRLLDFFVVEKCAVGALHVLDIVLSMFQKDHRVKS